MAEKRTVSEALEQAARELEAEVKRAVEYIETNIVPKARRDGEKVLRRLSEELSRWADRLHDDEAQNRWASAGWFWTAADAGVAHPAVIRRRCHRARTAEH